VAVVAAGAEFAVVADRGGGGGDLTQEHERLADGGGRRARALDIGHVAQEHKRLGGPISSWSRTPLLRSASGDARLYTSRAPHEIRFLGTLTQNLPHPATLTRPRLSATRARTTPSRR